MSFSLLDLQPSKTDWAAVDRLTDEEIRAAIASDPDAASEWTAEEFRAASVSLPPPKKAISIRIDADVLDWFKSLGPGYQTRMNMILRGYMQRHREGQED